MLEEVNKMLDMKPEIWDNIVGGTHEDTAKAAVTEGYWSDSILSDDVVGTNIS